MDPLRRYSSGRPHASLELNCSGMVVQYPKDLLSNFKSVHGCFSDNGPKPLTSGGHMILSSCGATENLRTVVSSKEATWWFAPVAIKGLIPLRYNRGNRKGSSTEEQHARAKGGRPWARERADRSQACGEPQCCLSHAARSSLHVFRSHKLVPDRLQDALRRGGGDRRAVLKCRGASL